MQVWGRRPFISGALQERTAGREASHIVIFIITSPAAMESLYACVFRNLQQRFTTIVFMTGVLPRVTLAVQTFQRNVPAPQGSHGLL